MLLAILLFPMVSICPGYVIGWALDIFSFRHRTTLAQYVIAIALSNAFVPTILFLAFRFGSNQFGVGTIIIFCLAWAAIQIKFMTKPLANSMITRGHKMAFAVGSPWIIFCIILLVDIQIGQRLYFNAAAHDFTTRTAVIDAISRTGVPPINPGYYPGHFERITELYYFWYIPGSIVDMLGGQWVDARMALFSGITWSGLALMATIATYLRLRNPEDGVRAWHTSMLGSQLLAVGGMDFIPVTAIMIAVKTTFGVLPFDGRIEGWNMPIMSWLNALTWVPNHIASTSACMVALLALISGFRGSPSRRLVSVIIAGISIGSALGLSIWVALTFGIFMAFWGFASLLNKSQRWRFWAIAASGALGLLFVSQFLLEALASSGSSAGGLPISLYVRRFTFTGALAPGLREVMGILFLPVNYFLELGFFFVIALIWFRQKRRDDQTQSNPFFLAEMLLLATVAIFLSFVRSTVLVINDLGMRGWLLGQFVLVVWAVDILNASSQGQDLKTPTLFKPMPHLKGLNRLLTILLIVGILTTTLEAASTRFWAILVDVRVVGVPNELSPDTNLGERTYAARLAYEYIRDHTPQDFIIQSNPNSTLDRPGGLYGTRQMVIADRTAYGVPVDILKEMLGSVGQIFQLEKAGNWAQIDEICEEYSIQAIVVNDTDPLWSSLPTLGAQRTPLYINQHYAVFSCST